MPYFRKYKKNTDAKTDILMLTRLALMKRDGKSAGNDEE